MLGVLTLAAAVRIHPIAMPMLFPQRIDEHFVLGTAGDMLRTGDPNAHFFIYPSLPTYLTVAGLYAGFLALGESHDIETVTRYRLDRLSLSAIRHFQSACRAPCQTAGRTKSPVWPPQYCHFTFASRT